MAFSVSLGRSWQILAGITSADAFVYPTASHAFNLTCDGCSDSSQIFLAQGDCQVQETCPEKTEKTACPDLSSVDMCYTCAKNMCYRLSMTQLPIPMTWRKASQNPRATLQSAGWDAGRMRDAVIFPICHTSEVQILPDGSHWFAGLPVLCVRRNLFGMDRTFGRADYASRGALHALFGFGWSSLDGIWVPHGATWCHMVPHGATWRRCSKIWSSSHFPDFPEVMGETWSEHSWNMLEYCCLLPMLPEDNVTLPGGPTGFDVFVSPVVESWINLINGSNMFKYS